MKIIEPGKIYQIENPKPQMIEFPEAEPSPCGSKQGEFTEEKELIDILIDRVKSRSGVHPCHQVRQWIISLERISTGINLFNGHAARMKEKHIKGTADTA